MTAGQCDKLKMTFPSLSEYLLLAPRQDRKFSLTPELEVALKSFPGQALTLPQGSHQLAANPDKYAGFERPQLLEDCLAYLEKALQSLDLLLGANPCRLLLILPDKTRTAIAAHLLVDAMLILKERYPPLELTVLFGLGTHQPMTEAEMIRFLGETRYEQLKNLGVPLKQQTTLDPLMPQGEVYLDDHGVPGEELDPVSFADLMTALHDLAALVPEPSGLESQKLIHSCHTLSLPLDLWQHDLAIVAGDAQLHPYEGRSGSGGIHKMLVVGLANIQSIRSTHNTRILLAPHTRVGNPDNAFVRSLDRLVSSLTKSLQTRLDSRACTLPLGLSVATNGNDHIYGLWLGQQESQRQRLAAVLQETFTATLPQSLHLVVSDVQPHKGTDVLASARALQYLCQWDETDNVLLSGEPHQRVALLFHPQPDQTDPETIANRGTKKHLDVLVQLVQERRSLITQKLAQSPDCEQFLACHQRHRQALLSDWMQHLKLVSEAHIFLAHLSTLAIAVETLQHLNVETQKQTIAQETLKTILKSYSNPYSDIGRALGDLYKIYETSQNIKALLHKIQHYQAIFKNHEGLGEGGQRTLRLVMLLEKFQTLLIATDHSAVLRYLPTLDLDLTSLLPQALRPAWQNVALPMGILGIIGIDLGQYSPQNALDIAIAYTQHYNADILEPKMGFLHDPLIIRRA